MNTEPKQEGIPTPVMQEEIKEEKEEVKEQPDTKVMNSIFSAFANTEETYTTYSVYLLRETDSIESIIETYGISREELSYYNDLENLTVGSKIIIPTTKKDVSTN